MRFLTKKTVITLFRDPKVAYDPKDTFRKLYDKYILADFFRASNKRRTFGKSPKSEERLWVVLKKGFS